MLLIEVALGGGFAEVTGKLVPKQSFPLIADRGANPCAIQKGGIKGYSHPQSGTSVSRLNRALVEKTCRGNVAHTDKIIAALHETFDLCGGQMQSREDHELFLRRRLRLR